MSYFPFLAATAVLAGLFSAIFIAIDLSKHPQRMKVMNAVWVLTGLWAGLLGLWAYILFGRQADPPENRSANSPDQVPPMSMQDMPGMIMPLNNNSAGRTSPMAGMHEEVHEGQMHMGTAMERPRWQAIALSTLHCGAGCTLADLTGEWFTAVVPISVGGSLIAGSWIFNYLLALVFGFWFQYLAIRSMGGLSAGRALGRAVKADFLSLTAWQAGMYGWMAIVYFVFFAATPLPKSSWIFWFMMQLAMCAGFLLAYPVNAWMIRLGIKKAM